MFLVFKSIMKSSITLLLFWFGFCLVNGKSAECEFKEKTVNGKSNIKVIIIKSVFKKIYLTLFSFERQSYS